MEFVRICCACYEDFYIMVGDDSLREVACMIQVLMYQSVWSSLSSSFLATGTYLLPRAGLCPHEQMHVFGLRCFL